MTFIFFNLTNVKQGYVYIMSNQARTTLYIGVTSLLDMRILQHKSGNKPSFTKMYNLFDLVYFEPISGMDQAIKREKQLKNWRKEWKWNLIKEENPDLIDLAKDWYTEEEIELYRNIE